MSMRSPKVLRGVAISGVVFLVFISLLLLRSSDNARLLPISPAAFSPSNRVSRLHFLTVATNTEINLCRLVLSASVLSYPQPVLVDWAGEGEYNASETHLAKIVGPLRYFESLPQSRDSDIVLLVDGYDVVMQLGPDVLLQRYFASIAATEKRMKAQLGVGYVKQHGIYNSIIFGPDKTCFPDNPRRVACWSIPESPLPADAFGPTTDADMEHARPRWLNSGTIMGPVGDMRKLFRATADKVTKTWDPEDELHNSDQLYFGEVWGDQEYDRTLSRFGSSAVPNPDDEGEDKIVPDLTDGRETDLHIGLDYDSSLFQTVAGYENYLTWMTFHTPQNFESETVTPRKIDIQKDLLTSPLPFAAVRDDEWLSGLTWKDLSLGINVVTGFVFPILHFTGDKGLRDFWWGRMWFYDNAERLLRATAEVKQQDRISETLINGIRWERNIPYKSEGSGNEGVGAWSDQGERFSWKELCEDYEDLLFKRPDPPEKT
jgi:hypothetical protein